jgi:beta-glucosidase
MNDIEVAAPQHSFGNTSFHLDVAPTPLFPFGYGLSYTEFSYSELELNRSELKIGDSITVSAILSNLGNRDATEVVQLYVRDVAASLTRPVRELKRFQRVHVAAGASTRVTFKLHTDDLAFYNRDRKYSAEPGRFQLWVGGDSSAVLEADFVILK